MCLFYQGILNGPQPCNTVLDPEHVKGLFAEAVGFWKQPHVLKGGPVGLKQI